MLLVGACVADPVDVTLCVCVSDAVTLAVCDLVGDRDCERVVVDDRVLVMLGVPVTVAVCVALALCDSDAVRVWLAVTELLSVGG